jgi:hypothetical protein
VHDYVIAVVDKRTVMERRSVLISVGWHPPPVGWVNTNGAQKDSNRVACGGNIGGSDGEWIGNLAKYVGNFLFSS